MEEKTYTIVELAKQLRNMAELTAKASNNWDNFEAIAKDMLQAVAKQTSKQ